MRLITIALAVLLVLIQYPLWLGKGGWLRVWELHRQLEAVQEKNEEQKLKNARSRAKMARKFNIPMAGELFDTTQPGAIDKIVKLLCDRGMVDPFDDNPMEVAGSKKWE